MRKESIFYFIDKLSVVKLCCDVLPAMGADIVRRRRCVLFCVESSALARAIVCNLLKWLGVEYHDFDFRLMEAKDEDGCLLWLKVFYFDLNKVFTLALTLENLQDVLACYGRHSRLAHSLLKKPMVMHYANEKRIGRSLFFVRVAQWALRHKISAPSPAAVHVFVAVPSSIWLKAVCAYGQTYGIAVEPLRSSGINLIGALKNNLLSQWVKNAVYYLYAHLKKMNILKPSTQGPALMVEYYGQLNLKHPQFYCDLFFYNSDILGVYKTFLTFNLPNSPLDEGMMAQLSAYGIAPIALHPKATRVSRGSFYPEWSSFARAGQSLLSRDTLTKERLAYDDATDYWQRLFEKTGTKVYISWFKYSEEHMAIADGIRNYGGVAAIYQRAFEEFGSVESMVDTDIVFGFSPRHSQVEGQAHSRMAYHVAVGYVGDHRFVLVQDTARQIRQQLHHYGAKKVMAYFDENSLDDDRWYYGHGPTRANYAFLLDKVLTDKTFGLVLKPKVPSTLRKRLGTVSGLLAEAQQTGRCFIFETGNMHGVYSPAVAAKCADIAVHGHLFAATAAVESALAGVPTLVLDREGWKISLFYRLKKGKVVFEDWPQLWEMCELYWSHPQKVSGLGDWSEVMDDIDPFRDGQAAQRMATYIAWLLEGFQQRLSREQVMAQACERYSQRWGKDKVYATR